MRNHLLTASALVVAPVGLAVSGANGGSPPTVPGKDYVIPVERANAADRPTDPPQPAMGERKPEGQGNSGGDVEEQELQNMFPSTPWPKDR